MSDNDQFLARLARMGYSPTVRNAQDQQAREEATARISVFAGIFGLTLSDETIRLRVSEEFQRRVAVAQRTTESTSSVLWPEVAREVYEAFSAGRAAPEWFSVGPTIPAPE